MPWGGRNKYFQISVGGGKVCDTKKRSKPMRCDVLYFQIFSTVQCVRLEAGNIVFVGMLGREGPVAF